MVEVGQGINDGIWVVLYNIWESDHKLTFSKKEKVSGYQTLQNVSMIYTLKIV